MSFLPLSSLLLIAAALGAAGDTGLASDGVLVAARSADLLRPLRLADPVPLPAAGSYGRAAAGEIVTGLVQGAPGEPHRAWAVAVLDVPVDSLWAAVNDELGFADEAWGGRGWVVDGQACADGRASLVTLPVPILPDRWWVVRYRQNPTLERRSDGTLRELSWREEPDGLGWATPGQRAAVEGGREVAISRGAWLLIALDEQRTLVEYQLQSDAGGSLPQTAAAAFCASAIRNTLRAMEARAARGAAGCSPSSHTISKESP